jgi:hypothetical protein
VEAAGVVVPTILEDRATALNVLEATADLWQEAEGNMPTGFRNGVIDRVIWEAGYATMRRLGFIDGSVPLDEMIEEGIAGS